MKRLCSLILLLAWGLWLGGLVALFIFAQTLFARSRPVALSANPILFGVFERWQLMLAFSAMGASAALAILVRSRAAIAVLILVGLATVFAITSPLVVTKKMQALYAAGQSSSPEFKKLHGQSMLLY